MATQQDSTQAAVSSLGQNASTAHVFEVLTNALAAARELREATEAQSIETLQESFQANIDRQILSKAISPINFTPIPETWQGGKNTNTEARKLVAEIRGWVNENLPNHSLNEAIDTVDGLFVEAWSAVDEALHALSSFRRVAEERAPDLLVARPGDSHFISWNGRKMTGLDTAELLLHRWQDRGGVVGNVAGQPARPDHPITELAILKRYLRSIHEKAEETQHSLDDGFLEVQSVAEVLRELLPEGSKEKALASALVGLCVSLADAHFEAWEDVATEQPESESATAGSQEEAADAVAEVSHG